MEVDEIVVVPSSHPKESKNLPWVEKYRPQGLGDLVSHEEIIKTSRFQNIAEIIALIS